jgi:hypothetical protein
MVLFVFEFPMYVICVSGRLGWVTHVSKGGMCRVLQVAVLSTIRITYRKVNKVLQNILDESSTRSNEIPYNNVRRKPMVENVLIHKRNIFERVVISTKLWY